MRKEIKYFLLVNLSLLVSIVGFIFPYLYDTYSSGYWMGWSTGLLINVHFGEFGPDILIVFHLGFVFVPLEITAIVFVFKEEFKMIHVMQKGKELHDVVEGGKDPEKALSDAAEYWNDLVDEQGM